MKRIGVLALQGAVSEHFAMLRRAGAAGVPVKRPQDLEDIGGLIIPGGESTAISRLIEQNGLYEPIRAFAQSRPVMGTCAGLILCGTEVAGDGGRLPGETAPGPLSAQCEGHRPRPLELMDIAVNRNGFGRQAESFEAPLDVEGVGLGIPGVFIRAPYIERLGPSVTPLASVDGKVVMAESGAVLVMAFHPELTEDTRVAEYFLRKIVDFSK